MKMNCKDCKYCHGYLVSYATGICERHRYECTHPDQDYIKDYFKKKRMVKESGFICFSSSKTPCVPSIKTSPAWCPFKRKD